jgi:bacterioferritin-associated ferredoxin
MIVCSCNVLTDDAVRQACSEDAVRTPGQVYRCLGCSPQCGRCARTIRSILDQAVAACPAACAICPAHDHALHEPAPANANLPHISDLAALPEAAE